MCGWKTSENFFLFDIAHVPFLGKKRKTKEKSLVDWKKTLFFLLLNPVWPEIEVKLFEILCTIFDFILFQFKASPSESVGVCVTTEIKKKESFRVCLNENIRSIFHRKKKEEKILRVKKSRKEKFKGVESVNENFIPKYFWPTVKFVIVHEILNNKKKKPHLAEDFSETHFFWKWQNFHVSCWREKSLWRHWFWFPASF